MRRLTLLFALGACGGGGDDTIDITHDACSRIPLMASAATALQSTGITDAIALWRARGVPSLELEPAGQASALELDPPIEIYFEGGAPMSFGFYDDEVGTIHINASIENHRALAIVIAHELGHAFGLEHVSDRTSLMNPGNYRTPPTEADQAALEALWGPCAAAP